MSNTADLPSKIFNTEKQDYHIPEIILGEDPGLLDSIHTHYPDLWELFLFLRQQDWSWFEFPFEQCMAEFANAEKDEATKVVKDMMIKTLAWQWEADSVASRSIVGILANVVTDSRVWAGYVRINDNENVHALTYSEVVRNSFENPDVIKDEMMAVEEAQARMKAVADVMHRAHRASHMYALGMVENNQELYNDIYMYFIALYFLERIQFMASFAVTFTIGKAGCYQPIADAVRKICMDEYNIHAKYGEAVIRHLHRTERGKLAYEQCRQRIIDLAIEITRTECGWIRHLHEGGKELLGSSERRLMNWSLFSADYPFSFLDVKDAVVEQYGEAFEKDFGFPLVFPEKNPLPFMEEYIDLYANQASPQEQDNPAYEVNQTTRIGEQEVYELDI
ncbi:ribonucleotide-diphosphate reductase subunit beta [Pseudomonas phage D6]|nr:ribonucleotide-diphosphate reductase subunit beta [Pseudomonas phage D6]